MSQKQQKQKQEPKFIASSFEKEDASKDDKKPLSVKRVYTIKKGCHVVQETPKVYETITKKTIPAKVDQWVDDLVQRKKEQEFVIKQTDGKEGYIAILSSQSQHQKGPIDLRKTDILMFFNQLTYDVRCLRDLKGQHIPIIQKAVDDFLAFLKEKFGFKPADMVVFLHYLPSTYALHVHIMHKSVAILTHRSHLLEDVIANIEKDDAYYQKATLEFVAHQSTIYFKK